MQLKELLPSAVTLVSIILSSTFQLSNETMQEYIVEFKFLAPNCGFTCLCCNYYLSSTNIHDQFIQRLCNKTLQTGILAKANHLKELESVIKHAEAFEAFDATKLGCSPMPKLWLLELPIVNVKKKATRIDKPTPPGQGCGSL